MENKLILSSLKIINRCAIIVLLLVTYSCVGTMQSSSRKEKAEALERLGNSLYLEGNAREGLAKLLEAEKLDPSNPDIQHEIAIVYQKIDQFDLSLKYFKKAIDLKPDFPKAYNNLGILYFQMGDSENALKSFKKAVSYVLYQTPHYAYHNMGLVYYQMKEYQKAIELYNKALSESPEYLDAYLDLAKVYDTLGENEKAIITYDNIIKKKPDFFSAYLEQAKVYQKTGQIDKAVERLNYIIGTDPRSPIAREAIKLLREIQSR